MIACCYRFDATQALRQVLARAVVWGMIEANPAKLGVDNPSPRRRAQRPFESWADLDAVAANLSTRYRPMVIFAAATGLRPAEWLALEWRDIDLEGRVVYVHRSFTKGRLKCPKTEASRRAVPLQTIALEAIERQRASRQSALVFPAERGGYLDRHNFATGSGSLRSSRPGSRRCVGSTISATPSRTSRSVPAYPPSTSPAAWAPA
jgi:integrase